MKLFTRKLLIVAAVFAGAVGLAAPPAWTANLDAGLELDANILSDGEDEPDTVYVAAGTLDTPLEVKFKAHHIFVRSRASWYEIQDGLPQYATYEESER